MLFFKKAHTIKQHYITGTPFQKILSKRERQNKVGIQQRKRIEQALFRSKMTTG